MVKILDQKMEQKVSSLKKINPNAKNEGILQATLYRICHSLSQYSIWNVNLALKIFRNWKHSFPWLCYSWKGFKYETISYKWQDIKMDLKWRLWWQSYKVNLVLKEAEISLTLTQFGINYRIFNIWNELIHHQGIEFKTN